MRSTSELPELRFLEERVLHYAHGFDRQLPEMRFFVLDGLEFTSLLEKKVFPTSPVNIWEGKRMVNRKFRIEEGLESSLYYEVVQTGNPSYAYLNYTNSAMMQASVMAHVVGHCEFSELNVLKDSTKDRTEYVMFLAREANSARDKMGTGPYFEFWNACESAVPMISPHSQYNVENSVEGMDTGAKEQKEEKEAQGPPKLMPMSFTLDSIMKTEQPEQTLEKERYKKEYQEQITRKGFHLKAPCQDIFGFLRRYAPASSSERKILNYLYMSNYQSDFVIRTQIMNEGWAMYWEKKIMTELFKERACKGIIDYAKVFAGVCQPRPFYMRNPYHVGFHLWNHIEEQFRLGRISLDFIEEKDMKAKQAWNQGGTDNPIAKMTHLVGSITDYEFIRRYLSEDLIEAYHLNRIPKMHFKPLGLQPESIIRENDYWVWLHPSKVKKEMLSFFTHFHRPRIYIVDTDFLDGGLLLFHRNDKKALRQSWIKPTLVNLNRIWKGPVGLISGRWFYGYVAKEYKTQEIKELQFEEVLEAMRNHQKPFSL